MDSRHAVVLPNGLKSQGVGSGETSWYHPLPPSKGDKNWKLLFSCLYRRALGFLRAFCCTRLQRRGSGGKGESALRLLLLGVCHSNVKVLERGNEIDVVCVGRWEEEERKEELSVEQNRVFQAHTLLIFPTGQAVFGGEDQHGAGTAGVFCLVYLEACPWQRLGARTPYLAETSPLR